MTTVSQAIEFLRKKGYQEDFNLQAHCLERKSQREQIRPSDFEIDQSFRFEGESDPSDEAIVYGISALKGAVKGVLVNAYGVYSDPLDANMAAKFKTPSHSPQESPLK